MTQQRRTELKDLQKLDMRIQEARSRIQDFDPMFEEIELPALTLESELGTTRTRAQEMKLEERRLVLSIEEKKSRHKRLEERLGSVRNLREEAAVSAELEMIKRALQSDEQEVFTLLDQVRKIDERLVEVERAYSEASSSVEPKKEALLAQRDEARSGLAALEAERDAFVASMNPNELKTYNAIRSGGRRVAVAELTEDGACGNCFGIIPLQLQNEIRHATGLIRCEACGVILAAPEPVSEAPEPAVEVAVEAASEEQAVEGGVADEALVDE